MGQNKICQGQKDVAVIDDDEDVDEKLTRGLFH